MKRQFVRSTSGWIPVSVLLLLIVALVAGQAEADLPGQPRSAEDGQAESHLLERRQHHDDDRMPLLVDAFLVLTMKFLSSGDGEAAIPDNNRWPAE